MKCICLGTFILGSLIIVFLMIYFSEYLNYR